MDTRFVLAQDKIPTAWYNALPDLPEPLQPPPATSTWPSGSRMAVWPDLATFIAPVAAQVPAAGSYSSALVT